MSAAVGARIARGCARPIYLNETTPAGQTHALLAEDEPESRRGRGSGESRSPEPRLTSLRPCFTRAATRS